MGTNFDERFDQNAKTFIQEKKHLRDIFCKVMGHFTLASMC